MDIPIEAICSLGVGGALAVLIFLMYRRDSKQYTEQLRQDRVFMEDRMNKIIERDQGTREANTTALTELVTVLERMNGKNKE